MTGLATKAGRAGALLTCAALMSGCVLPAWGEESYRGKGQTAAGAALSEVATTKLAVDALLGSRLPKPYADEVVSASELALGSIGDSFGSVQPPRGTSDSVREDVLGLLEDAEGAVADARIAVRRGDRPAIKKAAADLGQVADELSRLESELG